MSSRSNYDVIIAGGGPAGSSAAIHLASRGARVLLTEQKEFPRAKLCGEFISPECTKHFERLGVADFIFATRPANLTETVFYSVNGKKVSVPSDWFSAGGMAIGLSRAEMDERLLRRAAAVGVDVREDTSAVNLVSTNGRVTGVVLKHNGREESVAAPITIDATGRARMLTRLLERICSVRAHLNRPSLVAFKAHFSETRVAPHACEIYFYRGGYGGLSNIEGGLSNLCFIVNAREVKAHDSDPERVMRHVVLQNHRAAHTLESARVNSEWLAVSLEKFGRHSPSPAAGLLAIGDAASFIDPFTGSGMLMAMESGELVSNVIGERLQELTAEDVLKSVGEQYEQAYRARFNSRLRLCSMMRRAAFVPGLADLAIRFFGLSSSFRRRVASATRSQSNFGAQRQL